MKDILQKTPKFALPFTILSSFNSVKLIAGEDYRYTLTGDRLEAWLPFLLSEIDGNKTVSTLINNLDKDLKSKATDILIRLYGERVLIDTSVIIATPKEVRIEFYLSNYKFGYSNIFNLFKEVLEKQKNKSNTPNQIIKILFQDRLDYNEILEFNQENLSQNNLSLWVSYGAMTRGFVSPIFFPGVGACLACLIYQFKRLSPTPEIYDELIEHSKKSKKINPVEFPEQGIEILKQLVLWKISLLKQNPLPSAVYRLHVLETDSFEVSSHQVFIDPECPQCRQ